MILLKSLITEIHSSEEDIKKQAQLKGYDIGPVYHGTIIQHHEKQRTVFRKGKRSGFFFTDNEIHATQYTKTTGQGVNLGEKRVLKVYLKGNFFDLREQKTKTLLKSIIQKTYDFQIKYEKQHGLVAGSDSLIGMSSTEKPWIYTPLALTDEGEHPWAWRDADYEPYKPENMVKVIDNLFEMIDEASWEIGELWAFKSKGKWIPLRDWIQTKGYTGYVQIENKGLEGEVRSDTGNVYVVFDANQIKSADIKTFNDDGELIPLSNRFDSSNDDFRF